MTTRTVTITIGRNVGRVPLEDERWAEFRSGVSALVQDFIAEDRGFVTVDGNVGEGFWVEDGERFAEDNACWIIQVPADFSDEESFRANLATIMEAGFWLKDGLAHLAHAFGQESFALGEGFTVLFPSHPDPALELVDEAEAFLAEVGANVRPPCTDPTCPDHASPHNHLA
jgi:hypothetical protein